MRNIIRSIFMRSFTRIATPLTAIFALTGVLNHDFHIITGAWVLCLEMVAIYSMTRQNKTIRKYCSSSTEISFWSVRTLITVVTCVLVIAALIVALKYICGITFVARGIILGVPFTILVCQKFTYNTLLDMAVDELTSTSDNIN